MVQFKGKPIMPGDQYLITKRQATNERSENESKLFYLHTPLFYKLKVYNFDLCSN